MLQDDVLGKTPCDRRIQPWFAPHAGKLGIEADGVSVAEIE
jgi:hypothetical protein